MVVVNEPAVRTNIFYHALRKLMTACTDFLITLILVENLAKSLISTSICCGCNFQGNRKRHKHFFIIQAHGLYSDS